LDKDLSDVDIVLVTAQTN